MTIQFERQELRALALLPIRHLPPYEVDYTVACRVGKAVSVHSAQAPWSRFNQISLEITLSEP